MTNGESGRIVSWGSLVVALLLLVGTGATAYSDLNSRLAVMNSKMGALDGVVERLVRTEAEQASMKATSDRIEQLTTEILKELKRLNDNMIRVESRFNRE